MRRHEKHGVDLAIVTALTSVELEAVLDLSADWQSHTEEQDNTVYHKGTFSNGKSALSVVACAAHQMGMPATTALCMKVIELYRPRFLAMTGIAAGVSGGFGDILIADQSWDYGSGKSRLQENGDVEFLPAPEPLRLELGLRSKLAYFLTQKKILAGIRAEYRGNLPDTQLTAQIGPLASGASVLENKALIAQIRSHNRKLIGIEMETYGVFMAAHVCREPRPLAMSIKSVCDFGDSGKSDIYQASAAYTRSRFLYEFAVDQLIDGTPE